MGRLHVNSAAISRAIGFLIPLLLALHWPLIAYRANVEITLLALRCALVVSACILFAIWAGARATRSELKWTAVLTVFLLMYLAAAICGTNITRGLQDWVRVATAMFAGFGLVRALRHEKTTLAFGVSCIAASLVSCALILAEYWHYMGIRPPTYEGMRVFKELVLQGSGVALNPLASAAFLFCLLGMCILPFRPILGAIGVFVLLVVALLTGSRAPLGLLLAGGVILLILNALRSERMASRIAGWAAIAAVAVAAPIAIEQTSVSKLSSITEGRYDVWTVGWAKFLESPFTGHGPESWKDDLFSRLPGYYKDTGALQKLRAGGYHSEYVTLLAEGGLLCFFPAALVLFLLLTDCLRITFRSRHGRWNKQFLVFTCLFFCVRAFIEIPGLFGYGQDVIDYLAYMFLALVASRKAPVNIPVRRAQAHISERIGWKPALDSVGL